MIDVTSVNPGAMGGRRGLIIPHFATAISSPALLSCVTPMAATPIPTTMAKWDGDGDGWVGGCQARAGDAV
jgi:hypothetical protein